MTDAPTITCTATLRSDGAMSTIPVDFDPRAAFGRARPPVVVTINGYTYRSTIAIMSGETFVPLRTSNRIAARVEQGGSYEVTLTLDTAPREVAIPAELATALDVADARGGWERLSFTTQREHADGIGAAKRKETRAKRIAAAVAAALDR